MDLITGLAPFKRLLFAAALAGGLAGLIVVSLRHPWFESTVRLVVVPSADPTRVGNSNAIDDASASLPMLVAVLRSRSVGDAVVDRLDLLRRYGVAGRDAARAELWRHVVLSTDRKSNFVVVTVEDPEARGAQRLAAAVAELALAKHEQLWAAQDRRQQRNLVERLAEIDANLARAEEALRRFRIEHHVVDLTEQVRASVAEAAAVEHIRLERRLALDFARGFGGSEAPEVQRAAREHDSAVRALAALQHGDGHAAVLLPLDELAELQVREAGLRRAVELQLARRELVTRQLAQLDVAAARPAGRAELVDPADEPRRPTRSSRWRMAGLGTIVTPLLLALYLTRRMRRAGHVPV